MKVYLDFLGCRLNEAELQEWARDFRRAGHQIVADPALARVCVVNTCAVTSEASRKSRQRIRHIHKLNPDAAIVAAGCDATFEGRSLAELPGVVVVLDNRQKRHLVERTLEALGEPVPDFRQVDAPYHPFAGSRTRAFLKVQDGCNNRCTYCLVRILRGEERSKPPDEVLAEVHRLVESGYKEIVLTGVHLAAYGRDQGTTLAELTARILAETDVPRLRLSSLEPWDIPEDFFSLWSDPRLGQHLHLPLQSGCDATLRRMGRKITSAQFADLVRRAREAIPGLTVTTDLMVGFPGETDEEFRESLDFVRSMGFGHIHLFPFSPRPGTPAARLPGRPDGRTVRKRLEEVRRVAREGKLAHMARFVGEVRPVLWESHDETGDGWLWSGLTDNYIRVRAATPAGVDLHNRILPTRLLRVGDGVMFGKFVHEDSSPQNPLQRISERLNAKPQRG